MSVVCCVLLNPWRNAPATQQNDIPANELAMVEDIAIYDILKEITVPDRQMSDRLDLRSLGPAACLPAQLGSDAFNPLDIS